MHSGPHALSSATDLEAISYKSRWIQTYPALEDKIMCACEKIENNLSLEEEMKFNRHELVMLMDIASLVLLIEKCHSNLILDKHYAALYSLARKAQIILNKITDTFDKSFYVKAGTLCFDNSFKKIEAKAITPDCIDSFVLRNITAQGHTVLLTQQATRTPENRLRVMVSHLSPTPKQEPFSFEQYLVSDIYHLDFSKLVTPKGRQLLEAKKGSHWLNILSDAYKKIEEETLKKAKQGLFKVDDLQILKVGFLSLLGILGHTTLTPLNFKLIRDKLLATYNMEKTTYMLCSEYVARIIIASLISLNENLKQELDLKENVILVPFNRLENLTAVHPGRLLAILKDCLIQEPPAENLKLYCRL